MKLRYAAVASGLIVARLLPAQVSPRLADAAAVRTAQSTYQDVEAALKRRQLTRRDTTVQCPPDSLEARGSVYRDRRQLVRRLDTEGGTEDHVEKVVTYFDTLERARFTFAQRGAVNGTHQEERVYYDEHGRVVRRMVRQTHGPGYPFDTLSTVPRLATWIRDLCG